MRVGPRPLPLYLSLLNSSGMIDGVKMWMEQAQQLMPQMSGFHMPNNAFGAPFGQPFTAALAPWQSWWEGVQEALPFPFAEHQDGPLKMEEAGSFLAGVQAYHAHPFQRDAVELSYTLVVQKGRAKLFHCGGNGAPVLLVASVINKPYIFDLLPDASLVNYLKDKGHAVYLVDWGNPETDADPLTMETAITQRLMPLVDACCIHASAEKIAVVGYCLGGIFALAVAQLAPEKISSVACVATPWDFSQTATHKLVKKLKDQYTQAMSVSPLMSVDVLQAQFALLSPYGAIRRMAGLKDMAQATDDKTKGQVARLVAIEDWLNDGIPLERAMAETVLFDWHLNNAPMEGKWLINGEPLNPEKIEAPVLVAIPERDLIVPKASAIALVGAVQMANTIRIPAGHIGLMVGRNAPDKFYKPLATFLALNA